MNDFAIKPTLLQLCQQVDPHRPLEVATSTIAGDSCSLRTINTQTDVPVIMEWLGMAAATAWAAGQQDGIFYQSFEAACADPHLQALIFTRNGIALLQLDVVIKNEPSPFDKGIIAEYHLEVKAAPSLKLDEILQGLRICLQWIFDFTGRPVLFIILDNNQQFWEIILNLLGGQLEQVNECQQTRCLYRIAHTQLR